MGGSDEQTAVLVPVSVSRSRPIVSRAMVNVVVAATVCFFAVGLLIPWTLSVREAARRIQCVNNLKQIGLAVHNYSSIDGSFPMFCAGDKLEWRASWATSLLPFMEQGSLYNDWNYSLDMTSPENMTTATTVVSVFVCPSEPAVPPASLLNPSSRWGPTSYAANYGGASDTETWPNGVIVPVATTQIDHARSRPLRSRDIRDGLSNTAMVAEKLWGVAGNPVVMAGERQAIRCGFLLDLPLSPGKGNLPESESFVTACKSISPATQSLRSDAAGQFWAGSAPAQRW